MDEAQVRRIVREELTNNYRSGAPEIPPHTHDGNDNLLIPAQQVGGFVKLLQTEAGQNTFGQFIFGGAAPADKTQQTRYGAGMFPIPMISGSGVGVFSQFNQGQAPDGYMLAFINGLNPQLLIAWDGGWYYIDLTPL